MPTAVRGEAGTGDRAAAAEANRLVPPDDSPDAPAANRVAQLRSAVRSASVIDGAVAVAAERAGVAGGVEEILTSDVTDLKALARHHATVTVDVVRV